jgi:hypothetical protein
MVDFIKITNAGINPDVFLNNSLLSFTERVDMKTGELVEGGKFAKFRDMKFFISGQGKTGMAGSLHKYFNEGSHNYDDFSFVNLRSAIEDLHSRFGIDPKNAVLNNIEFGVNLEVPFCPDDFIDSLVTHNYTQFNSEKDKNKNYYQVAYSQFIVKIYNKGLQFNLSRNVLRFEVKIVRMAKLAKNDIHSLHDLTNREKLQSICEMLLKVFGEIIYWDDSINLTLLTKPDQELLRDGYNPKFWQDHHRKTGSNASKKLRRYQELIREYGNPDFQSIRNLIAEKWDSLLWSSSSIRDITDIRNDSALQSVLDITDQKCNGRSHQIRDITNTQILDQSHNENTSCYNLSIVKDLVQLPMSERVCLVTGLDISMQKETSRFLSVTGIRYYQDKFPDIFNELQERLTSNWANEPLEKRITEIAHSVRNAHHSRRIHTQKAIKRLCSTPALFNNLDLISQHKKNIANR